MINIFKTIAGAKTKIIIIAVIFVIGVATGAWLCNKIYAYGKINMLNNYIDRMKESHDSTVENLGRLYSKKIKIAQDSVKVKEIKVYVKDNRECDINSNAEQLLDSARTGLSIPSGRADERARGLTPITQRQQIESCAKDGLDYRNLLEDNRSLQQFIRDNWKGKKRLFD